MKTIRLLPATVALLSAAILLAGCAVIPTRETISAGVTTTTDIANGAAVKAAYSPASDTAASAGISVNASASISLKPDVATFTIGVETSDANAAKARSANDAAMQKVYDALKAQGVDANDLQTASYDIYPRYDNQGSAITGYTVNNQVLVEVRNLDKLGDILGAAGSAGANTAGGVSFDVSDRTAAYNQALEQAMSKAQARAKVIADACGVQLGRATVINESSNYSGPVFHDASLTAGAKDASVPVSAGQLEISASVSVSYAIGQ